MKVPRKILTASGIFLSLLFLYFAFRNVEWENIFLLFRETNYFYLIPIVVFFFADFSLRALRWKFLLLPVKKCGLLNLLSSVFIGFFANNLLPMRAGEVIRAFHIGIREKISKMSALASIAVERVLDGYTVLLALVITFFIFPFDPAVRNILIAGAAFFSACAFIFYFLLYCRELETGIPGKIRGYLVKNREKAACSVVSSFIIGLGGLKSRQLLPSALLSAVSWALNALVFLLTARAMGIAISYPGAAFVMAVTSLGISIPSSPGYIGVFEYFGILAATTIGIPRNEAAGYILFCRIIQTGLISIAGSFFLLRENISVFQLGRRAEAET